MILRNTFAKEPVSAVSGSDREDGPPDRAGPPELDGDEERPCPRHGAGKGFMLLPVAWLQHGLSFVKLSLKFRAEARQQQTQV